MNFGNIKTTLLIILVAVLVFTGCDNSTEPESEIKNTRNYEWELTQLVNPVFPDLTFKAYEPVVLSKNEIYIPVSSTFDNKSFCRFNGNNLEAVIENFEFQLDNVFYDNNRFLFTRNTGELFSFTVGGTPEFIYADEANFSRFYLSDKISGNLYLGAYFFPPDYYRGFRIYNTNGTDIGTIFSTTHDYGAVIDFAMISENSFYYLRNDLISSQYYEAFPVYVNNGEETPLGYYSQGKFLKMNSQIYMYNNKGEFYKLQGDQVELVHTFVETDNSHFFIRGRNENDLIFLTANKLFHYNGADVAELYDFNNYISVYSFEIYDDWLMVLYQNQSQSTKILRGYLQ